MPESVGGLDCRAFKALDDKKFRQANIRDKTLGHIFSGHDCRKTRQARHLETVVNSACARRTRYAVERFDPIERAEIVMAELKSKVRNKLPANDFAEPEKRAYPIEDKAHAQNAKARASQQLKAGNMSKAEAGKIDKKANAVLKSSSDHS